MNTNADNYKSDEEYNNQSSDNGSNNVIAIILAFIFGGGFVHLLDKWHEKKVKNDAYKKGMDDASKIYESKFEELTESFLSKEKSWKENEAEYIRLINDYEEYIGMLEDQEDDSVETQSKIYFFKQKLGELKDLQQTS